MNSRLVILQGKNPRGVNFVIGWVNGAKSARQGVGEFGGATMRGNWEGDGAMGGGEGASGRKLVGRGTRSRNC